MSELVISSRRRRIFAFMIDHFILSFLAGIGGLFAMGKHWDVAAPSQMIVAIISTLTVVMILCFMKDSFRGMSPGRFVLGIAVRDYLETDKLPNIFRLALRNLLLVIWPIECLVLVFSKQKRRLGDRLAKTVIVRQTDISAMKRFVFFVFLIIVFGGMLKASGSAIVKNSSAYEQAISYVEDDSKVKDKVGDIVGYGSFPSGSVQVQNQYGYAQIKIKVNGDKGNATVVVVMAKEPETNWHLKEIVLTDCAQLKTP